MKAYLLALAVAELAYHTSPTFRGWVKATLPLAADIFDGFEDVAGDAFESLLSGVGSAPAVATVAGPSVAAGDTPVVPYGIEGFFTEVL